MPSKIRADNGDWRVIASPPASRLPTSSHCCGKRTVWSFHGYRLCGVCRLTKLGRDDIKAQTCHEPQYGPFFRGWPGHLTSRVYSVSQVPAASEHIDGC